MSGSLRQPPNAARNATALGGAAAISMAAIIAGAVAFVGPKEGGRAADGSAVAYADRLANGLPTACEGITGRDLYGNPIVPGHRYTKAECDTMLAANLQARQAMLVGCLTLPPAVGLNTRVAVLSLAYNIGTPAFCRSTVAARFRAGNYTAACDGFRAWNRASGRVVQGLVNRRAAERDLCLSGLSR